MNLRLRLIIQHGVVYGVTLERAAQGAIYPSTWPLIDLWQNRHGFLQGKVS